MGSQEEMSQDKMMQAETITYRFSFCQYFFRNLVFKVLLLLLFAVLMAQRYSRRLNGTFLLAGMILIFISVYQFTVAATSTVIVESGQLNYYYVSRYNEGLADNKLNRLFNIYTYHNHYIDEVSSLTVKGNHILIRGKIKCQNIKLGFGIHGPKIGAEKILASVKIPKYFHNNAALIDSLKVNITPR